MYALRLCGLHTKTEDNKKQNVCMLPVFTVVFVISGTGFRQKRLILYVIESNVKSVVLCNTVA